MEVGGSATDRVKVRFPWYRIFVKKSETSDELKAEVSAKLVGAVWANVDDVQSITDAGRISHTLQVVSGILKTKHDTAKNSVGNIR